MVTLPIIFNKGHIFINVDDRLWLLDTGAPTSFGDSPEIKLDSRFSRLHRDCMGLSTKTLSQFTGVDCEGLLGADVLSQFDHIIDIPSGIITISTENLEHPGQVLHLSKFMGIPILSARISGNDCKMFFDTGAQLSYFQEDSIMDFPTSGSVTDFYPGVGQFETKTHLVQVNLGDSAFTLRCGILPDLLGATLMMSDTVGIIGNQLLIDRAVGYFPRRGKLSL